MMRKVFNSFKRWALAEWKFFKKTPDGIKHTWEVPGPKVIMHEKIVDFIHGSVIGLLLGLIVGLFIWQIRMF